MKIKILSDSTCDLSQDLLEKYDITVIPLTVIKGGQSYQDGVTITPADIFAYVDVTGDLCSTTATNIDEYSQWFAKFANDCDSGHGEKHSLACFL